MGLKKVLIANRSEVALRIQATCKARGLQTVAVYTQEDRLASFVYKADYAYSLSLPGYHGYLDGDDIIKIALKSGTDAIHPGYGFLSENAEFAQKVIDAGLVWIGPRPEVIRLMGDKVTARQLIEQAGVPVVPGAACDDLTPTGKEKAKQAAVHIGFPVILKDPKSGGGKGMRKITAEKDFDRLWDAVVSESKKLTGSTVLLLEKYVTNSRHVEVQIAGDGKRCVHFFERECSIQRRHQKIIEEAPCQFISEKTKHVLYDAALKCAASVNYDSIGTVEFLVTPQEDVYFLEMNTRLQVEHGVTEMITGFDLVGLQLDLSVCPLQQCDELHAHPLRDNTDVFPLDHAKSTTDRQSERRVVSLQVSLEAARPEETGVAEQAKTGVSKDTSLPLQSNITKQGHAIQCRVYAEDPDQSFTPQTGTITHLHLPQGPFYRLEHDLDRGTQVTPFFDPMLGKVLAFGYTRDQAVLYMKQLLYESKLEGVTTNKGFLLDIVASPHFAAGEFHTQFLSHTDFIETRTRKAGHVSEDEEILAGLAAILVNNDRDDYDTQQVSSPGHSSSGIRQWRVQQWK